MKILIEHLTGRHLDWAVAHYLGESFSETDPPYYLVDWVAAGRVLDHYPISVLRVSGGSGYAASYWELSSTTSTEHQQHDPMYQIYEDDAVYGSTFLEAALRCFVLHKAMGRRITVPDIEFEVLT